MLKTMVIIIGCAILYAVIVGLFVGWLSTQEWAEVSLLNRIDNRHDVIDDVYVIWAIIWPISIPLTLFWLLFIKIGSIAYRAYRSLFASK